MSDHFSSYAGYIIASYNFLIFTIAVILYLQVNLDVSILDLLS